MVYEFHLADTRVLTYTGNEYMVSGQDKIDTFSLTVDPKLAGYTFTVTFYNPDAGITSEPIMLTDTMECDIPYGVTAEKGRLIPCIYAYDGVRSFESMFDGTFLIKPSNKARGRVIAAVESILDKIFAAIKSKGSALQLSGSELQLLDDDNDVLSSVTLELSGSDNNNAIQGIISDVEDIKTEQAEQNSKIQNLEDYATSNAEATTNIVEKVFDLEDGLDTAHKDIASHLAITMDHVTKIHDMQEDITDNHNATNANQASISAMRNDLDAIIKDNLPEITIDLDELKAARTDSAGTDHGALSARLDYEFATKANQEDVTDMQTVLANTGLRIDETITEMRAYIPVFSFMLDVLVQHQTGLENMQEDFSGIEELLKGHVSDRIRVLEERLGVTPPSGNPEDKPQRPVINWEFEPYYQTGNSIRFETNDIPFGIAEHYNLAKAGLRESSEANNSIGGTWYQNNWGFARTVIAVWKTDIPGYSDNLSADVKKNLFNNWWVSHVDWIS